MSLRTALVEVYGRIYCGVISQVRERGRFWLNLTTNINNLLYRGSEGFEFSKSVVQNLLNLSATLQRLKQVFDVREPFILTELRG